MFVCWNAIEGPQGLTLFHEQHWDQVFTTKSPQEVSWTQEYPTPSMDLIQGFNLPKSTAIIDIGGGDSLLVDTLLTKGYTNITVLDISSTAINRAKLRLGKSANKVKWVVSDITERKQLEQNEYEQRVLAEALRDTAMALNSTLELDDILDRILANVGMLVSYDSAMVLLVEDNSVRKIRYHNNRQNSHFLYNKKNKNLALYA